MGARSSGNGLCPPLKGESHFCPQNESPRSGHLSHLSLKKTSRVSSGSAVTGSQPSCKLPLPGSGEEAGGWGLQPSDVRCLGVFARTTSATWLLHAAAGGGGVRTSPPGAEELGSASSSDTPVPSVCPPPINGGSPAPSLWACWEGRAPWPGVLREACSPGTTVKPDPGLLAGLRSLGLGGHCELHVLPDPTAM